MREREHAQLLRDVEELRRLVAACSTETIVGACTAYWIRRDSATEDQGLMSAARQWAFLLGLMLTTPEPTDPRPFGAAEVNRSRELLNEIFSAYAWAYFPEAGETITDEWRRTREVAMPAFLAYFNQGLLASTDQVEQRIRRYLSPFDNQLAAEFGLNASQAVEICRWVTDSMQNAANALLETSKREKQARLDLLGRAERERWDMERLRSETQAPGYRDLAFGLLSGIRDLPFVSLTNLKERFGTDAATAFWNVFSAKRGEIAALTYPTEANPAEERSLYRIDDDHAMCPLANQLFLAVLNRYERHLASGGHREGFFSKRDATLEQEIETSFRLLLGSAASFFPRVFETAFQQYEHDLVIRVGRAVLVVEAKASPPVEPFRDPDRAFVRIRHAFKSDRGIQHAFEQGRRLWDRWAAGARVRLYDERGRPVCEFDRTEIDELLLVCATRDNFGILATDLSLLVEKGSKEPYPWCVNTIDLDAIADAWAYFGWDASRFLAFLRDRVKLHGRAMCADELEMVGFFIEHGGLHWLMGPAMEHVWLNPTYSDVFDRIYKARLGGAAVRYEPNEPAMSDLRESLRQGRRVPIDPKTGEVRKKQGRNEPCACGSGRKYKRCCGR